MNKNITKLVGMALLAIGAAGACLASTAPVPEIDPATGANALALVAGALMIIRSRKR